MTASNRRLFFALWPDEQQRSHLRSDLDAVLPTLDGRVVPPDNWHVTLVFIGLFPTSRVPELIAAAKSIPQTEIELTFDRVDFWKRPRIACLRASIVPPGLLEMVAALHELLEGFGFVPEARTYQPHLTLARKASAHSQAALGRPIRTLWRGFELLESVSTRSGVSYLPVNQGLLADS